MKIYQANKKGFIHYFLIGFLILPVIIFFLDKNMVVDKPIGFFLLWIPFLLMLWIYFDTYYKIENDKLIYRCGFLRGTIEIQKINEIKKGKTMWIGIRPALARKGLIIRFNKYDEIYIAPENNSEVISDLLKVNSEIQITE